ncbi:Putative LOC100159027, partial [Caligus rogercresseyi]
GSLIPVIIDVSANHLGHFVFKICPNNNIYLDPPQSCFEKYILKTGPGTAHYKVKPGLYGLTLLYLRLPPRLSCRQCILQWTYVGGNNWGICPNGTSAWAAGTRNTSALAQTFESCRGIWPFDVDVVEDYRDEDYFEEDESALGLLNDIQDDRNGERRKKILGRLLEKIKELVSASQPNIEIMGEVSPAEEPRMSNRHG